MHTTTCEGLRKINLLCLGEWLPIYNFLDLFLTNIAAEKLAVASLKAVDLQSSPCLSSALVVLVKKDRN